MTDTATAADSGTAPASIGHNSADRFAQNKADLDRLEGIKAERKALADESTTILKRLEKNGVNRGALAEVRAMLDLSPAAIKAREESRAELIDWIIKPKLEEAEAGQADEA